MDGSLSCSIEALTSNIYSQIRDSGPYFVNYLDKLLNANGIFFFDDKVAIPPQLRAPVTTGLHKGHSGMWKMRTLPIIILGGPI